MVCASKQSFSHLFAINNFMTTDNTTSKTQRTAAARSVSTTTATSQVDWRGSDPALMRTLELVFFGHLQMADAADQVLVQHELGRPHHRVLYFSQRRPGITVGELMSLMRISNQALSRTTNQLMALHLIEQRYSPEDRRVRQHFLTDKGADLLETLTRRQLALIRKTHLALAPQDIEGLWNSLSQMSRKEDLAWVTPHPQDIDAASK